MSRSIIAFDRFAALLVSLVLLALGVGAIAWWLAVVSWLPDSLDLSRLDDATGQSWWPWATGIVGVLLILLGLRWLLAHLPRRGVNDLSLPGSSTEGRLRVAAGAVARAAAATMNDVPGVRSSSGRVLHERGQVVIRLGLTLDAGADLSAVAAACDKAAADLAQVLGRDDVRMQTQLKVAARSRSLPRVA